MQKESGKIVTEKGEWREGRDEGEKDEMEEILHGQEVDLCPLHLPNCYLVSN